MKVFFFSLLSIISATIFSQTNCFIDTIPYKVVGLTKKECFNKFQEKLVKLKITDSLSISLSDDKEVFTGKGKLPYNHIINYDTTDKFLNKTYINQPKGYISYSIKIEFQKKMILISLHDFEHVAKGTPWGKKSIGKINFAYVPTKSKDEELIWVDKIRKDIINYCEMFNTKFKLWFFNSLL